MSDRANEGPPSRARWLAALLLGATLWLIATFASQFLPQVALGMTLEGPTFALVGVLQALLVPLAISIALMPVRLRLRDLGLTTVGWRQDAVIGATRSATYSATARARRWSPRPLRSSCSPRCTATRAGRVWSTPDCTAG